MSHSLECKKSFAKLKLLLKEQKYNNKAELQCSDNKGHVGQYFKGKLN